MASIGGTVLTLGDWAKRLDKNGKIDKIVEMLSETNEVLEDMIFVEGNLPTGHKTTVRTGLPEATWRMINRGVKQSKSQTQQVIDTCGMLEAYAEVDKSLADLNNNSSEFRLSEDRAFLQAMNIEMAKTLFYGDISKTPERFAGLAPRFNTRDLKKAATAENVIDAGGTAAKGLTSIWLVGWGANTVHGIYPQGSKVGFTHEDKGQVTIFDAEGKQYEGYRSHYKWDIGLTVRDWRYVVRIANVDLKTIQPNTMVECMIRASELLPDANLGRPVFYMNRPARTMLRLAMLNKENVRTTFDTVEGRKVQYFDEIPVRRCDAILNTEDAVAA